MAALHCIPYLATMVRHLLSPAFHWLRQTPRSHTTSQRHPLEGHPQRTRQSRSGLFCGSCTTPLNRLSGWYLSDLGSRETYRSILAPLFTPHTFSKWSLDASRAFPIFLFGRWIISAHSKLEINSPQLPLCTRCWDSAVRSFVVSAGWHAITLWARCSRSISL